MKTLRALQLIAAWLAVTLVPGVSTSAIGAAGADRTRPILAITYPAPVHTLTEPAITVAGKAKDNVAIKSVYFQVNATGWKLASTTNDWSNWTAPAMLKQGMNIVQAYAIDTGGNRSLTNTVRFSFALSAPLMLEINGQGTVSPNYTDQWLQIGKQYTLTARPGKGFVFANWSGSFYSTDPTLTFIMLPNFAMIANFVPTNNVYGSWHNCDSHTRDLVSLELTAQDSALMVHAFGACSPTPCDWGVVPGTVYSYSAFNTYATAFATQYDFDFSTTILTGYLDGDALVVDLYTTFKDGSGRSAFHLQDRLCR